MMVLRHELLERIYGPPTLAAAVADLAAQPEYAEFADLWRQFDAGYLVPVARLFELGTELHRKAMRAAAGNAVDAPTFLGAGLEAAVKAGMPELDQYVRFVMRSLRPPCTSATEA
jgi:hypothetical protein